MQTVSHAAARGEDHCRLPMPMRPGQNAPDILRACLRPPVPAMFESLTQRLSGTIERLRGRGA